ncbi:MAG TPA: DUF87 domain-containing protein, partial [Gemmataceae bacterium]|nr:DUF87 domain-containing protein [Gemmataceae bacterium]
IMTTGLMRLSTGLLESVPSFSEADRAQLLDGSFEELNHYVFDVADRIILQPRFRDCDLNLIRALLYLQRDDPRIKSRLLSYLRAEDLIPADRALLGGLVPRCHEEDPQRLIFELGRLMAAVSGSALVLLVDQLEDIFNADEQGVQPFRRAIDVLTALGEAVPTSVVVIACLEQYFELNRQHLPKSKLDRLELDPEPQRLNSHRNADEVVALVNQRLLALYEWQELPWQGLPEAYPFTREQLAPLAGLRTRDVLTHCLRHQERCAQAHKWLPPRWQPEQGKPSSPPNQALDQLWNDFQASFKATVPADELSIAELVKSAVAQVSHELPTGHHFDAETDGRFVPIEIHGPDNSVQKLLTAVCNKAPQGGGLGKQIAEAEKRTGEIPLAVVRSTAFPAAGRQSQIGEQLAAVLRKGGRLVPVEDAEWRTVLALQQFQKQQNARPDFGNWLRQSRPLAQLPFLKRLLGLDELAKMRPVEGYAPPPTSAEDHDRKAGTERPPVRPSLASVQPGALEVGDRLGLAGGVVTIEPDELKLHAAFLGATGSGKTTAALNLIEQLLLHGIPAILVDRKGDLCRYADPAAWTEPLADPDAMGRRRQLRERISVALYTPGHPDGRLLTLPLVPEGIDQLPSAEREQLAGYAASALGGMLGYTTRAQVARLAILRKAIEVQCSLPGASVTVAGLQKLVESRDDVLLTAVGGFDDRHYKQLAQDLLALRINKRRLLEGEGEMLDVDTLLGTGATMGGNRTRLSVISTRFLGDLAEIEFWVAQLLAALDRWSRKAPSKNLQAVIVFDEADLYLPAVRQPATKAPMENLLRRARSAGLGVLLATQSPGDFDYKCRDNIHSWMVGQVKEEVALRKLRPMFGEAHIDPATRLPGQAMGQFHLLRGKEVVAVHSRPSLIRTEQLPEERILELARSAEQHELEARPEERRHAPQRSAP